MLNWLRERFMRRTISRDIGEELRFHLAQRTAEYERAGMGSVSATWTESSTRVMKSNECRIQRRA